MILWTGPERVGLSSIRLSPEGHTFSSWNGYEEVTEPLTEEALRNRVSRSGLPALEIARIVDDIWRAISLAAGSQPVIAPGGVIGEVGAMPFNPEDTRLSGVIWIILVVASFQLIARLSLPSEARLERTDP